MLQFSASGQRAADNRISGSRRGVSPVPTTQTFLGFRMLYVTLPISQAVKDQTANHLLFGLDSDASHGGMDVDPEGIAHLSVTHYPDAPISWVGEPGNSETLSLPHLLLTVQLPLVDKGRKFFQTSYALIDEDRAMMILRLGSGIPAKLANMSFPADGAALDGAATINVTRRGVNLLQVSGIRDAGDYDLQQAEDLLAKVDMTWGTPITNYMAGPGLMNMTFFQHTTKATVRKARKVDVSLTIKHDDFDPFAWIFADSRPLDAWWLEGDLEVTTKVDMIPEAKDPQMPHMDANITALRTSGAVLTHGLNVTDRSSSCSNADVIWTRMKLNTEKIAPYLPPGFSLENDEGVMMLQRCQPGVFKLLGDLKLPLVYNELWVNVFGTYDGTPILLPILLLVDDDVAVMAGQDYAGTPKKLANLTFTMTPDSGANSSVFASINRHGRQIFKFTGRIGAETTGTVRGVNDNTRQNSRFGFVMAHQFPRDGIVDRPMYIFPRGVQSTYKQREMTDLAVELGHAKEEPLGEWFVGEPLAGGYVQQSRDWGMDMMIGNNFQKLPMDDWIAWWTRNFQMLHM